MQKIAFIGPHVKNQWISGVWSIFGKIEENVSLEAGVKNLGISDVTFAKGCRMLDSIRGLESYAEILHVEEEKQQDEKLLEEAIENAKQADVVVMALGEHALQSGEATSRTNLDIAKVQMELFRRIYEINQNIVVLLFNGRPLTIKEISKKAKAVLEVWLPGTEGGNAIADILFGNANPSGKLAMSFPESVGQIPVFYNEFHTGRPFTENSGNNKYLSKYIDVSNRALYPFGYGLSYSQFEISAVSLSAHELTTGSSITASVTVKNAGTITGKEVVQMYLQDKKGSVARPVRELKGFSKIELKPGEQKTVSFDIKEDMLRFYNLNMEYTSEPGEFNVFIGDSSVTRNKAGFVLR
jgi:beta-glucosidase